MHDPIRRRAFLASSAAFLLAGCDDKTEPSTSNTATPRGNNQDTTAATTQRSGPPDTPAASRDDHPNVLLIVADDLGPQLGCMGDTFAKTPTLDAFAGSGTRFDAACCASPACNPSRVSLLTGVRPETSRVLLNSDDWRESLPLTQTLPHHLAAHGYHTAAFGKVEHAAFHEPKLWHESTEVPRNVLNRTFRNRALNRITDTFAEDPALARVRWGPSGFEPRQEPDHITATAAASWLANQSTQLDRPWLAAVGLHRPHLPFAVPQAAFDAFDPAGVTLPDPTRHTNAVPPAVWADAARVGDALTDDQRRGLILAYHACVHFVDQQIARVLAGLRRSGQAGNTVVVVTSDHGFMLGEQGLWKKGTLLDACLRVPLLLRGPGVRRGVTTNEPVCLTDLYPTLCGLANVPTPGHVEGVSLQPFVQGRSPERHAFSVLRYGGSRLGRSVRRGAMRYTAWPEPESEELYDLASDPTQANNLVADPSHSETLAQLRAALARGWSIDAADEQAAASHRITSVT